jgi:hypothetical protein
MSESTTIYCKYCGVSQSQRYKKCEDGTNLHRFIRTQTKSYDSELKQIWLSRHENENE